MQPKESLITQLDQFTEDFISLQGAVRAREDELKSMEQRQAQLKEEILRNQGAMAYNKILAGKIQTKLDELEKAAIPAAKPASS